MKKLVRHRVTKAFLTKEGAWTEDIGQARQFLSHLEARDEARRLGLNEVEFYFYFDDMHTRHFDFSFRSGERRGDSISG